MKYRVLVVDDEKEIRNLIERYLRREGMEVVSAASGREALDLLRQSRYDIVVLDVMMPGMDGFSVLTEMREKGQEVPVLFLTAKGSDGDIIQGLGMGGDEYMTKPFSPAVLTARIKALLRLAGRTDTEAPQLIVKGGFSLDREKHRICKNGKPLELTALEYAILAFFICHPGQVFTKEQLHSSCWSETYYDDNTVAVYIRRLREKIEPEPSLPRYLLTMRGLGYYFEADEN